MGATFLGMNMLVVAALVLMSDLGGMFLILPVQARFALLDLKSFDIALCLEGHHFGGLFMCIT